jgi:serine phosphatase RsbU (regulator of sigma subunit)/pSer/pThr/pTyr-binding forkhead associated (FHA) protein
MAPTLTVIPQDDEPRLTHLSPKGALIGRASDCDVLLDGAEVSRHHARVFRDPFGRWILQDLGSHNGVWVGGKRVAACPLSPGQRARIGLNQLVFNSEPESRITADATLVARPNVVDDGAVEIASGAAASPGPRRRGDGAPSHTSSLLSQGRMRQLNELSDHVAELSAAGDLYPETCRCVARHGGHLAAVVRLDRAANAELLALHRGGPRGAPGECSEAEVHLSQRVLRSVRQSGEPVLAGSAPTGAGAMELTVVDARQPRMVCAAPVATEDDSMDVLYVDVPMQVADEDTLEFVQAVARQVSYARKSLLLAEDRARQSALDDQLQWARNIQSRLVPQDIDGIPGVDVATCYRPAMWVGGDYCDVWPMLDGRIAFCVADVSGKGLPAAMVMSGLQATLRATMAFSSDLAEVMEHVNRQLERNTPEEMFATMFVGIYRPTDGALEYVNAGHMPPYRTQSDAAAAMIGSATGIPVGVLDTPFERATATLAPGEGLVLVTDGITEAEDPDENQFGLERLGTALTGSAFQCADEIVERVVRAADTFRQHTPQGDDVTVLALMNTTDRGPG